MTYALRQALAAALLSCALVLPATATDKPEWKLTVGQYLYGDYAGTDLNLRWQRSASHAWIGGYRDRHFGQQLRAGADTALDLGRGWQLQPSLQIASQGFAGGSLTVQAGTEWYALAGIGRTNLRPYFNLNFDPNDAVTLGVGHQAASGASASLFVVADDRLHTRQRDWHLLTRVPLGPRRLTVDVLRKSGLGDDGYVQGWGLSVTCDWPHWFLRVARDPYQNFAAVSATRFAAGLRF